MSTNPTVAIALARHVCDSRRVTTCHVCSQSAFEPATAREDAALRLNRCTSCGFVYLEEWEESLRQQAELYDYYSRIDEDALPARHSPENRDRQVKLLEALSRLTNFRKLLDVGCGDGQFLQTATEEGWDALGIDLSKPAIELCRRRGLSASHMDFFDESLDPESFDVITMSELIEHVPAPQSFLKRAEGLLAPGGILYLTTPNFGSLSRRLLGNAWSAISREHIGYFETSTLAHLAACHTTLEPLRTETNNLSPSAVLTWLRKTTDEGSHTDASARPASRDDTDQRLRRLVHGSSTLRSAKSMVNRGLSVMGIGDTIVAWFRKPTTRVT